MVGGRLDWIILEVFSNASDSMILYLLDTVQPSVREEDWREKEMQEDTSHGMESWDKIYSSPKVTGKHVVCLRGAEVSLWLKKKHTHPLKNPKLLEMSHNNIRAQISNV